MSKIRSFYLRHHIAIFTLSIYLLYLYVLFFKCELTDRAILKHDVARLIAPLFELILLYFCCTHLERAGISQKKIAWSLLSLIVAGAFYVIYASQLISLRISNNFITVLAIKNSDSARFITSPRLGRLMIVAVLWLFLLCYGTLKTFTLMKPVGDASPRENSRRAMATTLVILFVANLYVLFLQGKNNKMEAGFWQVPVANFVHNAWAAKFGRYDIEEDKLGRDGAECFSYPSHTKGFESAYPFMKTDVYQNPLPFPLSANGKSAGPANLIVVFTEGISARLIGAYGGGHDDLTPNIDGLANKSMQVNDYFNHTAATYRALIGQLSSGYALADEGIKSDDIGWEIDDNRSKLVKIQRPTLPRLIRGLGYESYFFSPHREERIFTTMLKSLGFDRVYTDQSIGTELLKGAFDERSGAVALEDQSLFAGLVEFLKERTAAGDVKPFFAATYNVGTHAFLDIDKPKDVGYGDESIPYLNKLHNYDVALGKFLNYFYGSPYAKNTILVLTSDHSTYPEPSFRVLAGDHFKPYFVDRIPLLIDDPMHELPKTFDAHGRNSLDLAPTIFQLLGIRDAPNSFLGRTLFEDRNFPLGIASLGDSYYMTSPQGVFAREEIPPEFKKTFDCEVGVVSQYYRAESSNHIFITPSH